MPPGAIIYSPTLVQIARTAAKSAQAGNAGAAAAFAGGASAGALDGITLDVSMREAHTFRTSVTNYEVEKGANITDHARNEPAEVTFDGIVTNTPISRDAQQRIIQTQAGDIITTTLEDQPQGAIGYAEEAFVKLLELRDAKVLCTLVTALKRYENMLITSLVFPRDATIGDALSFTCSMKEIRIVENKVTVVKLRAIPAQKKANLGKQPSGPAKAQQRESALNWIAEGTGLDKVLGLP